LFEPNKILTTKTGGDMEKLHELMGPTLSLIVLGMMALVLIWLILKAVKQGGAEKKQLESKVQNAPERVEAVSAPDNSSEVQTVKTAANSTANVVEPIKKPAVVIQSSAKPVQLAGIPEDSILRRHYLTEQALKKAALSNPIPTDSILRRHYAAMQQSIVVDSSRPKKTNSIEQAVNREALAAVQHSSAPVNTPDIPVLPEDSILRRHFLSQLQAEVKRG
jgi:hypothetical protein